MPSTPWPELPVTLEHFRQPPREYGILPFWFLNGELDPEEMRFQLNEFRRKGMPGVILHGRYGLEMPYIGSTYLDRIALAVDEAAKLGLQTWVYDEMNWPSGTADKRVLQERPDLAQRYIECISLTVRGPWFSYLTGADSRYLDFERSRPIAAFAIGADGRVIDLTPNLSFGDVIPWEAPEGNWRIMYIVEKEADYYIDALNPEATSEFLRLGYEPYARAVGDRFSSPMLGFYTDEPAMHYYLSGADNPVVPWTKDMFRRFQERNGYNLRPRLPDLFFDVSPDSARIRYDFYTTLTEFYSQAYYRQIQEWCRARGVLFTGHLLYEEWLRKMIRVEGNLFKHYAHLDVVGVDHLYPFIGTRDRPDEHVAMKVASSAAHHYRSPRLLCESFGGIFMDATMQRMKWIADWEYVLGVNLLNPHGFHYTLEGPRKRDWPPSQFYQYPWWHYYAEFSTYISRLSFMLSGGRHVAQVAMLWPINAMFGTYTPQAHNPLGDRTEADFNVLTDLLLRLHYDYDYLDEDVLAGAQLSDGAIGVADESYKLLILPPLAHLQLSTLERIEQFVQQGGRVLATIFLPDRAYSPAGLVDISARVAALFGVEPGESQRTFQQRDGIELIEREHAGGGKTIFLRSYALARQLPLRLQQALGVPLRPEHPAFVVESEGHHSRYWYAPTSGQRQEVTAEVIAERQAVAEALQQALAAMVTPDVLIDNQEVFYLHRVKDGVDLYFLVNPTFADQLTSVALPGDVQPVLWDPTTGNQRPIAPAQVVEGYTHFRLTLPAAGSLFVLSRAPSESQPPARIIDTNLIVDRIQGRQVHAYGRTREGWLAIEHNGRRARLTAHADPPSDVLLLDGEWEFTAHDPNALVIGTWLTTIADDATDDLAYVGALDDSRDWLPMVPGAWSYQLPAEPDRPYPIAVWYRSAFHADYLPEKLELIVDGFAGADWRLSVNGQPITASPVRSTFDAQMRAVDITPQIRTGENSIALRLTLTSPTDGLLDLLKLMGNFSLAPDGAQGYRIVAPRRSVQPATWTEQGYPFYSGRATYRGRFQLPGELHGQRIFVEPELADDVLEVLVNGQSAGVRLWPPYVVEISQLVQPGENDLELRVANTLVNLLEAVERPSGLTGPVRLVPYRVFAFELPGGGPLQE